MRPDAPVIAIIPARGGSKRIPRKNLRMFGGKPLVVHSIEDALQSKLVDRTIVSTDDDEIREVSEQAGAEVIMRPAELSTDEATSESALLHVLDTLAARGDPTPSLVVFLQCTSPARSSADVDGAIEQLQKSGADSLFSATRFNKYVWTIEGDSAVPMNYDYRHRWREQDFPLQFMENGSLYVFRPALLRETNNRLGGKIAVYEMAAEMSFQIDSPEDLRHSMQ